MALSAAGFFLGVPAVFYNNGFAVVFLYVRQSGSQHVRLKSIHIAHCVIFLP